MISLNEAIQIAIEHAVLIGTEKIEYQQSIGRILAQNVFSDVDIPPFNKSAMDGYACRKEDLGKELELLEIIPAGQSPTKEILAGQCSKIMTGAKVPEAADTVFMVEHSKKLANGKIIFTGEKTRSNICAKAEDLQTGDLVLKKGSRLKAQQIAVLAAVGCTEPLVYKQPKVGIISTGSELLKPNMKPVGAQIRNSNGPQLVAQALEMHLPVTNYGIVPDNKEATHKAIQNSVKENNVTIISGGVSVGDFDYVPVIIEKLGFNIHFNKLSVKPGKHTTFASKVEDQKTKYIIGLPGNPVSSFIQFEIFAKVFLQSLMGFQEEHFYLPLCLSHDFTRRKTDRDEFLPVRLLSEKEVEIISYNGSAHIHAYHDAIGFVLVARGTEKINKGTLIDVRPL